MRRPQLDIVLALVLFGACRTGPHLPPADAIVEGRADVPFVPDTVDATSSVAVERAHWTLRPQASRGKDFWTDISVLDLESAQKSARSFDERTFAVALQTLMTSDPEAAAIAFQALIHNARDRAVRARARIGLTMALSWRSDWPALAQLGPNPDSLDMVDSATAQAGVERWGRALASLPPPVIEMPSESVTLPLRRSAFGTPVVSVRINGKTHEFWFDTGASMTLLSDRVARDAGVRLAAHDTLALGVVGGHIAARAVIIDSLAIGSVVARGLGAALVNGGTLRLDHRIVNGLRESVLIDGVIGTDFIRHLDVVVDAGASTITLKRPRRNPRAVRNLYWVGYPVVRLVTKDGHSALFGLDTGAEATYVTTTLLRKQPRTSVAMRRGALGGLGAREDVTKWVVRDISLSDGDYAVTLRNAPVTAERHWTFVTFDGVLGSDVALASRMHLDFLNGVFDIRRSESRLPTSPTVTVGH